MLRIIYFFMLIAVIILGAIIILQTGGMFGAIIGVGFLLFLVYKNNRGEF